MLGCQCAVVEAQIVKEDVGHARIGCKGTASQPRLGRAQERKRRSVRSGSATQLSIDIEAYGCGIGTDGDVVPLSLTESRSGSGLACAGAHLLEVPIAVAALIDESDVARCAVVDVPRPAVVVQMARCRRHDVDADTVSLAVNDVADGFCCVVAKVKVAL